MIKLLRHGQKFMSNAGYFAVGFIVGTVATVLTVAIIDAIKTKKEKDAEESFSNTEADSANRNGVFIPKAADISKMDVSNVDLNNLIYTNKDYIESATAAMNRYKNTLLGERYSPTLHSDDDGASYDFDEEEEDIFPIAQEEWGEEPSLERQMLTYYSDHVLTDENENPLVIDDIIGPNLDIIKLFESINIGEIGDEIYIRNYKTGCDYAIQWSDESYSEKILGGN